MTDADVSSDDDITEAFHITCGVFLAEPISEVIGGLAAYTTMRLTAWRHLVEAEQLAAASEN